MVTPAGWYLDVHTRRVLRHLPDFWKGPAPRRVRDLLPPGGTLVLCDLVLSFEPDEAEERIESWLDAASSADDGWTRTELEEHLREHSTSSWLLGPLLKHAGFEIREISHRLGAHSTYVCTAR